MPTCTRNIKYNQNSYTVTVISFYRFLTKTNKRNPTELSNVVAITYKNSYRVHSHT